MQIADSAILWRLRMIKKLRRKFITISIAAVSSVMVLLFLILNTANFISFNSKLNNTLDMLASNGGVMPMFDDRMPRENGMENPKGFDERQFNKETPFSTRYFVLYYDENGLLTGSNFDRIASVTEDDTEKYISVAVSHGEGYGFTSGYKYRVVRQADGYMAIFVNDDMEIGSATTILFSSLGATAVCIGLISVIIILFSKRAMDPVIKSNEKQKQFITDASHELKTPITVITASLGVLEMEVGRQKWIDKAKLQTEKLTELVNSLVTLSRMDEEQNTLNPKNFDISEAVRETAESFEDFARSQGHGLNISIEDGITHYADEYSVRQLVSILLDNAIKYASDGTPVRFSLKKEKKSVVISTENECGEINTDELDRLFDRFYRADKARSSEKSGFGIGLSIAREICEKHGGSIKAECTDGKTVVFTAKIK